jgi:DNA mismatch endonuclease, patch repair protein
MSLWPGNAREEQTTFGGLLRSDLMSRIRSRENKTTEIRLIALLRATGLAGWRRNVQIVGHPDFVWMKKKVAVFVDGCFWHGHNCNRNLVPKTNQQIWCEKIRRNQARDRRNTRALRKMGWSVIHIWECKLAKYPTQSINRIRRGIEARD